MTLDELEPRQRQVATLVGFGLKYPEIARRLAMKPETARRHVNDIVEKAHLTSPGVPAYRRVMAWVLDQRHNAA